MLEMQNKIALQLRHSISSDLYNKHCLIQPHQNMKVSTYHEISHTHTNAYTHTDRQTDNLS